MTLQNLGVLLLRSAPACTMARHTPQGKQSQGNVNNGNHFTLVSIMFTVTTCARHDGLSR